jgi:hypothetical protein
MEEDSRKTGIERFNQARTRCAGAQFAASIDRAINKVGSLLGAKRASDPGDERHIAWIALLCGGQISFSLKGEEVAERRRSHLTGDELFGVDLTIPLI